MRSCSRMMKYGLNITISTANCVITPSIATNLVTVGNNPIPKSKQMFDHYQNRTKATSISTVDGTASPEVMSAAQAASSISCPSASLSIMRLITETA